MVNLTSGAGSDNLYMGQLCEDEVWRSLVSIAIIVHIRLVLQVNGAVHHDPCCLDDESLCTPGIREFR